MFCIICLKLYFFPISKNKVIPSGDPDKTTEPPQPWFRAILGNSNFQRPYLGMAPLRRLVSGTLKTPKKC